MSEIIWFLTLSDLLSIIFSRSLHVVANDSISSFLTAEQCSVVYRTTPSCPVLGRRALGCFHALAAMNNAVNIGLNVSLRINVFKFFGKSPEEGLLSHGNSNLNFLKNLHTIFHGVSTRLRSHQ